MVKYIKRAKIFNYKRFKEFEISFNENINLIVGDNESGKSTILSAIDLVLSASDNKVFGIGLPKLFNVEVIDNFLSGGKEYSELPKLIIELYLNDQQDQNLEGVNNSDGIMAHGIKLKCEPNDDLESNIKDILSQPEKNFPFEFYKVNFNTFQGSPYYYQTRSLKHIIIDSSQINYSYANKKYIVDNYQSWIEESEDVIHKNEYRRAKEKFNSEKLRTLNERVSDYSFSIKTDSNSNFQNDLTIIEDGVSIENKGKGRQCFIKADFALQQRVKPLELVLLEEPENHLSQTNMKKLVQKIYNANDTQLIIATHSDLICSKLDLRNATLLATETEEKLLLTDLDNETAKFFIKSPNNNILELILSKKVILVEGDAEYILLEHLYKDVTGLHPSEDDVHIIPIGGTSFSRFLEVAQLLGIKTAVVRDNDKDYQHNCVDRYSAFLSNPNLKIFSETNNELYTFEISIYETNKDVCHQLFEEGRVSLSVKDYMLKNKTEAAFQLLDKKSSELVTPNYIENAIEWIRV